VLDPIRRLTGVGEADLFGTEYAMRIWLNPARLESYNLRCQRTFINAIQAQNTQVPVGQLGDRPAVKGAGNQRHPGRAQSTLTTVKQFEDILLRVNPDGSRVYLRDVARVELGGSSYSMQGAGGRASAAAVGVRLSPSATPWPRQRRPCKGEELSKFFPAGVRADYPYDRFRIRAPLPSRKWSRRWWRPLRWCS